jgi:hypothetical protein
MMKYPFLIVAIQFTEKTVTGHASEARSVVPTGDFLLPAAL